MRIPKVIPDIVNRVTGRWAPPGSDPELSKGKPRLHLDYADRDTRREQAKSRRARGGKHGGLERPMVPKAVFSSYYGRPIVKAPPWGWPIGGYLWLGGIAGGSGMLAFGAQLMGNERLRRSTSLAAFFASGVGSLALVGDLGRPERMLNMFRVFKVTSPMSVGSYILASFATSASFPALAEMDKILTGWGVPLPLPDWVRRLLHQAGVAGTPLAGTFGPLLATYTGVLFADTSVPAWKHTGTRLPMLFGSSAALASGGVAMVGTHPEDAQPARIVALVGAGTELVTMHRMKEEMDPTVRQAYELDEPGILLGIAEAAVIVGSVGTFTAQVLSALDRAPKVNRVVSIASGLALALGSGFTRFGVLHAGHNSAHDPRYVIAPQRAAMDSDRAAGRVDENITTLA
ncbi:NrfD/PsrC family molybdoenzyme membrane anchor subunit [Corynebacterium uterequi]|uniref:Formate-dependent nitrite reductase, membrane component n=1 Tax=Corynebacterium uterequi TaxID=1072256 RepID=A0A0G3HHB1_9CORY|nr:NrfD/PsrC family molybdoenzyme membrane anchor subunit [Corynebacterium uterequi]AKK10567.1 formate-dependent nitrite reductase, membrane component [Corynebacterium uterequi]